MEKKKQNGARAKSASSRASFRKAKSTKAEVKKWLIKHGVFVSKEFFVFCFHISLHELVAAFAHPVRVHSLIIVGLEPSIDDYSFRFNCQSLNILHLSEFQFCFMLFKMQNPDSLRSFFDSATSTDTNARNSTILAVWIFVFNMGLFGIFVLIWNYMD